MYMPERKGVSANLPINIALGILGSAVYLQYQYYCQQIRLYEKTLGECGLSAESEVTRMHKPMAAPTNRPVTRPFNVDLVEAVDSFGELFDLLEAYAPMWYSEQVRDRAHSALILLRASLGVEQPLKSSARKQRSLEYSMRNR
jgi:hypothetical protein